MQWEVSQTPHSLHKCVCVFVSVVVLTGMENCIFLGGGCHAAMSVYGMYWDVWVCEEMLKYREGEGVCVHECVCAG